MGLSPNFRAEPKQNKRPLSERQSLSLEFGHLTGKYLLRNEILSELLKP
jgi:hypothetical protein